jgi:hypothetical protein
MASSTSETKDLELSCSVCHKEGIAKIARSPDLYYGGYCGKTLALCFYCPVPLFYDDIEDYNPKLHDYELGKRPIHWSACSNFIKDAPPQHINLCWNCLQVITTTICGHSYTDIKKGGGAVYFCRPCWFQFHELVKHLPESPYIDSHLTKEELEKKYENYLNLTEIVIKKYKFLKQFPKLDTEEF